MFDSMSRNVINLPPDKAYRKANLPHKTRENGYGLGAAKEFLFS